MILIQKSLNTTGLFKPRSLFLLLVILLFSPLLSANKLNLENEPITPIAIQPEQPEQKVKLGNILFHEPRLSKDNTISCASCHSLATAGVDGLPFSVGIKGQIGKINTPTVLNSGLNFVQFWDGRSETLEQQMIFPIHNPIEMGSNWNEVIEKLRADQVYVRLFDEIYDDGITAETIQDAIATFERSLVTYDSRFDLFLKGDTEAINEEERHGYFLFKSYGCASCHQGRLVGANMFEKMGIVRDYFADRGNVTKEDYGRFNVTGNKEHLYEFKVPSLRNIELTAPYFHDASAKTLQDAVAVMGRYQLGRDIPITDRNAIVAFLKTLTGKMPVITP